MTVKENTYTNFSLLCKVPTEADKLYYWDNMQKLFPLLDVFLREWGEVKILSHQHFTKLKWDAKEKANRSIGSIAPTGGRNNKWNYETLKKVMTLYLEDRTYHNYIFDQKNEKIKTPPMNKKGYIHHYSTEIFGRIKKQKPDIAMVLEQSRMDFRLKIPFCYEHEPHNMFVDISFNEAIFSKREMNRIVHQIKDICFATSIYKNEKIVGNQYYTLTYEDTKIYFKQEINLWKTVVL